MDQEDMVIRPSGHVVLSREHLERVRDHFLAQDAFSFDVETVGSYRGIPRLNTVTWLSMATHGMCVTIPMGHRRGDRITSYVKEPRQQKNGLKYFTVPVYEEAPAQLAREDVFGILRPLFFSGLTKVAHEATFDLGSIAKYYGEIVPGPYEDTKVIMRLIDENLASRDNGLKAWTRRRFEIDYDTENTGKKVEAFPFSTVAHYSYMDALCTWMLWTGERPKLAAEKLTTVHEQVEMPLTGPLTSMRLAGIDMDVPRLEELRGELSERLEDQKAAVYRAAGDKFNLNSAPQKGKILFGPPEQGGQGLPVRRRTGKGAPSTDADTLSYYPGNAVCRALLDYAETQKMLSTYVNSWLGVEGDAKKPPLIIDGRLYTEFQPHGTNSGRFSGRAPNLQNIPRPDTYEGKLIRGAFGAPPGYRLVVADYGQIELVILAHLIGHGALFDGFWAGVDPHTTHAAGVLGKKPADVTPAERQKLGKTLGFTIVNGAWWPKVAEMVGCDEKRARWILKEYDRNFPEVGQYKRARLHQALARPGVPYFRSLMGRKRRIRELLSADAGRRMAAERQAFNFEIQGGAADVMKLAIPRADYMLAQKVPDAYLTMTIHDELVAVAPEADAEECRNVIVEAMTGSEMQALIKVPLKVDAKVVDRWADAK